jgi:hypothetical protein
VITTRDLLPFLKIVTTAACFYNEGNFPVDKLRLRMWRQENKDIRTTLNDKIRNFIWSDGFYRTEATNITLNM